MSAELETLAAERACERLVLDSAWYNDHRDWARLAGLYAPDARLVRPSGEVIEGRDAIESSYRSASADRRTRHVCANIRVSLDGADVASGDTVVLLYAWTGTETEGSGDLPPVAAPALGEFTDTFVRLGDGWRIASRRAAVLARPQQ